MFGAGGDGNPRRGDEDGSMFRPRGVGGEDERIPNSGDEITAVWLGGERGGDEKAVELSDEEVAVRPELRVGDLEVSASLGSGRELGIFFEFIDTLLEAVSAGSRGHQPAIALLKASTSARVLNLIWKRLNSTVPSFSGKYT